MIREVSHNVIDFSAQYFLLRKKEGRIYSDGEVSKLPDIDEQHKYYHEWEVRKNSCYRLKKYLTDKKCPLQILEAGCGNGWLSAKLSEIPSSRVIGIDINSEELNQARRVFNQIDNLEFIECSLHDDVMNSRRFDVVVFAASIQYFHTLKTVLNNALNLLKPRGEIHLLDTHFYNAKEINAARQRSRDYFNDIGFSGMAERYFHHSWEELKPFNCKILYDPDSIINRLKKNRNPFYWVCIKENA